MLLKKYNCQCSVHVNSVSLMLTDTTFDFNNVLSAELNSHVKLIKLTNVIVIFCVIFKISTTKNTYINGF